MLSTVALLTERSTSTMTTPNLPTDWSQEDVLDGLDIVDKSTLVGVLFRIIGCAFKPNNDGVSICYIDAERTDGYAFTFLDSSTGVHAQVVKYLQDHKLDAGIDTGEYIEFKLIAPNGLRLSKYEVPLKGPNGQAIPGKTRDATTYYITTSGKRGARVQATEPVKAATATTKATAAK